MLELELDVLARAQNDDSYQPFSQTLIYPKDFQDRAFLEQCDRLAFHIARRCGSEAFWKGFISYNGKGYTFEEKTLDEFFITMFGFKKLLEDEIYVSDN